MKTLKFTVFSSDFDLLIMSFELVLMIILFFSVFDYCLASSTTQISIFISQVQITGGKADPDQDFIELFNPNLTAIDLKGYRLVKRSAENKKDESIKSWDKSQVIPAKSFFLWANSGYQNIITKPDLTTAATIADDNGVALRYGKPDIGQIVDSVAWGNAANGFKKVTSLNPGANQTIIRSNLYATASTYTIGPSKPRNSEVNDLDAAFANSQEVKPSPVLKFANQDLPQTKLQPAATTTLADMPGNKASAVSVPTSSQIPFYPEGSTKTPFNTSGGRKYLFMSFGALIILSFIAIRFFLSKTINKS